MHIRQVMAALAAAAIGMGAIAPGTPAHAGNMYEMMNPLWWLFGDDDDDDWYYHPGPYGHWGHGYGPFGHPGYGITPRNTVIVLPAEDDAAQQEPALPK